MKKILVTGGLGFIGLALTRRLLASGHDVSIVDNLSPQIHGEVPDVQVPAGARVTRLDVRHLADRPDLLEDRDVVFHLAAETGTGQSMYKIEHYVGVNELGTAALLEALGKCSSRTRQVVLASSRSVYGEGAYVAPDAPERVLQPAPRTRAQLDAGQWEPLDSRGRALMAIATPETLAYAPGSIYAATKASQELLLASAASALNFRSTVFRFQNVYGEGQSLRNPYTGIISIFFNRARQGLEIPLYEDGLESRDFIHIDDIVQALALSILTDLPGGAVLNLGAGQGTSVHLLATELLAAAELSVPVRVTGQFRVGDIRHCFADLGAARRLLGFTPKVGLAQGLRQFTAWAAGQPVHEDRLAQATEELRKKGLAN
jgi:dTDP-L-rhamnose 4-epimerase